MDDGVECRHTERCEVRSLNALIFLHNSYSQAVYGEASKSVLDVLAVALLALSLCTGRTTGS